MSALPELTKSPNKAEDDDATQLTAVLHDLSSASNTTSFTTQLSLLANVLSPLYSANHQGSERCRALAFLVLSRISTDQKSVSQIVTTLSAYINAQLQETSIPRLLKGISLLDALVQVDTSPSSDDAAAGTIAKRVLEADGLMESITDVLDTQLFTVEDDEEAITTGNLQPSIEEQHSLLDYSLAHLFSSLANIPAYRGFLSDRPRTWLEQHLPSSSARPETKTSLTEDRTGVLAAVTLTKLAKAMIVDPALNGKKTDEEGSQNKSQEDTISRAGDELEQLTAMLKSVVIGSSSVRSSPSSGSSDSTEAITSALEGLAYTSSQPELKAVLGNDDQFIRALVGIAKSLSSQPQANASKLSASYNVDLSNQTTSASRGNQAAAYGIATIMFNLFARKPVLTEEQRQVEALKRMANAGAATGTRKTMGDAAEHTSKIEDENMSDEAVHARVQRGIKNGAVEAIAALAKVNSLRVKQVLGSILLALVHEREDRLEFVKQGGYKALKAIIATLLEPPSSKERPTTSAELEKESLPALQALAKLVITTPPSQLFGAGGPGGALDAVRPVAMLLLHPDNSMLQRFEAMMALTNLASVDSAVAQRIYTFRSTSSIKSAKTDGLKAATTSDQIVQAVENQMLEDHKLVRRAAVELVCNLMISDESFARYSGDYIPGGNPSITTPEQARKASTPRLHILLALTDVRDLPTRLAASGALAMLTQSETACGILLGLGGDSSKAWEKIGGLLAPLKAEHDAAGEDNAFEEEEDEEVEEISTLPPDEGLVYRGLTIALNLFHHIEKLPSSDRAKAFKTADICGVTRHLINLLAIWTDKNLLVAKKVKPPAREVLDLGIECLRILKANDIQLVV
jgi:hypothetical protein